MPQSSERASSRPLNRDKRGGDVERRVLAAALELAARGGFEAVRQREVAERACVALGTLYKRFPSKDELLIGVLEVESQKLANRLEREQFPGKTPLERVTRYFEIATHYVVRKPRLGRAILRAVASGDKVSARVMAYQAQQLRHAVDALTGTPGAEPGNELLAESDALVVAPILLQVWFAALVGWSGELFDKASVVSQVREAAHLVLLGLACSRNGAS